MLLGATLFYVRSALLSTCVVGSGRFGLEMGINPGGYKLSDYLTI